MAINNAGLPEDRVGDPLKSQVLVGQNGKALQVINRVNGEVFAIAENGDVSLTGSETATQLATSGAAVNVIAAAPPSAGQVLKATDATHATWQSPDAAALKTSGASVDVAAAAPPSAAKVLTATDATHATWQDVPDASKLKTSGASVGVSAAAPPTTGQALIATAATTATWQTLPDASKLKTSGASVDVVSAAPPTAGQALVATDATHATWQTPSGTATAIKTSGADVGVSAAAPPSAGQVLTATDATHATWQTPAGGSGPLWLPPSTPHADDVEFEGTAVPTGFVLYDATAAAAIVPAGTPDPYSVPASGAAKYAAHTNWRRSWGAIQASSTDFHDMAFAKPITVATNMFVWARLGVNTVPADAVTNYLGLALLADAAGVPDTANMVVMEWVRGIGYRCIKVTATTVASAGTYSATTDSPQGLPYFGIQKVGTNYYGSAFNDDGTVLQWTVLAHAPTKAWVGIVFRDESTAPGAPIYRIDFIRRVDSAQGLPV
jgi:hypothetical protein